MHEQPHDIFVRDSDDLHCTISVPMVDAALGTTVTVDAILDGPTEITIPAGTQPGAVITLRGHGMPHLRSGVRGNLHAHVEVVVPSRLDHQDTELLRKLKDKRSARRRRGAKHASDQRLVADCSAGCAKHSPAVRRRVADALFYVDALPSVGELAVVDGDEGFHAATVRRIRPGEKLDLGDGAGGIAHCVVEDVGQGHA